MSTAPARDDAREMLRRLARGDESCLSAVLWPGPTSDSMVPAGAPRLDRDAPLLDTRTRPLVLLAALLALDASIESLRWAVDMASAAGVNDEALASVLIVSGEIAGSAQLAGSASRLGAALGLEPFGGDVPMKLRLLPQQAGVFGARDRL